ncbi:hypothetical protein [Absidia glauca]|uniref:Uncharacterized protein n=1 Tax=Absidia glauca TaxID=4829 RepID=A0A163JFD9_ABSGL|nr:hypothetical protein [Absidia glauca]
MSDKPLSPSTCANFSFFKEMMKELRRVDDNIILGLNSTDTHSENACGEFFNRLATAYRKREEAVDYCLKVMDDEIDRKTNLLQQDPDDYDTQSSIFSDETKYGIGKDESWGSYYATGLVQNEHFFELIWHNVGNGLSTMILASSYATWA